MSMLVPFGPQHPVLPEPLQLRLELNDEKVVSALPVVGYVHRGLEKLAEQKDFVQDTFLIERVCGICSFMHSMAYSMGIEELVSIASEHAFSDIEFDVMREMLTMFKNGIDEMSYEQKRVAIRTVVRRIIWDGENAHIVLFGAEGEDIEYPDLSHLMKDSIAETEDDEELVPFVGEDMDENSLSDFGPETKTHWGEDSK